MDRDPVLDRKDESSHRIVDTTRKSLSAVLHRYGLDDQPLWTPSRIEGPLVAAREGNGIVGTGRLYRNWLHPARWRLSLFVDPDRRQRGVGTALLDALVAKLPPDGRDLQAATGAASAAGIEVLRARKFEALMITRLGRLDPADVSASLRDRARRAQRELSHLGLRLVTLADRPDLFERTTMIHKRIYRDQHAWNPPPDLSPEQARQLFMDAGELDPATQFVAIRHEAIRGVASLRTTSDPNWRDLGWVGTVGESWERSIVLVQALIGACVDSAGQRDASIAIEVDNADLVTSAILDEFPITWGEGWLTYVRAR